MLPKLNKSNSVYTNNAGDVIGATGAAGISNSVGSIGMYPNVNYTTNTYDWSNDTVIQTQNEIIISRPGQADIRVGESLEAIMKRLAILSPDFDKMEKYPALRAAYENYLLIEAMIGLDEGKGSNT